MHYVFKQVAFVEYILAVVRSQPANLGYIKEIMDEVVPKLETPEATYAAFADILEENPDEDQTGEKFMTACSQQFGDRTSERFNAFKDMRARGTMTISGICTRLPLPCPSVCV